MSEETQQPAEQEENNAPQAENTATPEEQVEPAAEAATEAPAPEAKAEPETLTERPALAEPGDFDWDAFEADVDDYSAEDRASLETTYENSLNLIQEKEVVDGTVVSITKKEVVVNIATNPKALSARANSDTTLT